jgi:type IV secretion system protein VirD4
VTSQHHRTGGPARELDGLATVRTGAAHAGAGAYIGMGAGGPVWTRHEQAVLVLGPPRSGKTSCVVVPSILAAPGSVVSTSTKPDVLSVTAAARRRVGPCFLYDPSGTVDAPPGVTRIHWSPVAGSGRWDDALLVARNLVGATRSSTHATTGPMAGDHWSERAEALLGPLLHAAALEDATFETMLSWVDRRQVAPALAALERNDAAIAADLLAGIAVTDSREQSGIWSTASGVLAGFRSEAALASTRSPDFDPSRFCASDGTLYVCATGRHQALAAPLVVGLLGDVRAAAYARAARSVVGGGRSSPPVLLALDEVANIAPLPDLPAMVSEGGGQGLLTLACLQDLSQARGRWGSAADGFLSLFGTTVVLPGIGDVRTLEALSALAGETEVATRSVNAPARPPGGMARAALEQVLGGGRRAGRPPAPTVTTSTVLRRRLPVDVAGHGEPGMALVVDERNHMGWARLTPWFGEEPWRSAVLGPGRGLEWGRGPGLDPGLDPGFDPGLDPGLDRRPGGERGLSR